MKYDTKRFKINHRLILNARRKDFRRRSTPCGLAHPGVRATVKARTQRYVWQSIKSDCRNWARACLQCQRSKVSRHVSAPLGMFMPPSRRFELDGKTSVRRRESKTVAASAMSRHSRPTLRLLVSQLVLTGGSCDASTSRTPRRFPAI